VPDNKETLVSIASDPELTRASVDVMLNAIQVVNPTAGDYRMKSSATFPLQC